MKKFTPTWSFYCPLVLQSLLVFLLQQAAAQTQYECPGDWMEYRDNCYKFEAAVAEKYDDAWSKCSMYGAGLIHVEDLAENTFLTRWMQRNDPYHRDYYTSGVILPAPGSRAVSFAWQSTGLPVDSSLNSVWLEAPRRGDEGVIVYSMATNTTYGWMLGDPHDQRQYVCKIHKNEAYRIHSQTRGDDFGVSPDNIEELESGPVFLVQPASMVVVKVEGRPSDPAVLECIVQSRPAPVYAWYKGDDMDTPLSLTMDSRYAISNGKLEISDPVENRDSGFYICAAENKFGKIISERVEVTFGYIREFNNVADAGTIVSAYDGAKVECSQIDFKPAVSYQWIKGDYFKFVRPQFQSYMFISNNGKLYFSEVTTADEADYSCIVSLRGENQYQISTRQPPMRTSLPIPLVVIDQAAKAAWGPTIQDEFIQVFPSPPLRGFDVRMECFAYGSQSSPFKYMWTRDDGQPLPDNSRMVDHNRVLFITHAEIENGGVYRCTVSRGSATDSKTVHLELSAKPYFVSPLRNQMADIGSQLTWICNARGNPDPTYAWYKNGQRLTTDRPNRVMVQTNVLTIVDLDKDSHDGMYQCQASNVLGTSVSTAQLKVMSFPPNFEKHPAIPELVSPESGDVTLPCDPEGAPHPSIDWDHDGQPVSSSVDKYQILGNGNLRVRNLGPADEGRYTCTATNIYDSAKITTLLKITGGASITVAMTSHDVVINETVLLRCEASFPAGMDTVYEWMFNDHIIDFRDMHYRQAPPDRNRGGGGLYVVAAQVEHEGRYTCTARTPFNTDMTSGYLTVYGPPRAPSGVTIIKTSVTTSSVVLRWTPGASKGDVVAFHVIQMANELEPQDWHDIVKLAVGETKEESSEPDNDRHSTEIKGLHPGTSYHFRILGINMFGRGESSRPSPYVRTLNAPPAVAPQDLRGGGGSVGVLTIRWNPLQPSEYGGLPVKYRVYWRKHSPEFNNERQWSVTELEDPQASMHVVYVRANNFYTLYDTMIHAFNSLGAGPNTTVKAVYSAEGLPLASPGNVRLSTFNSTAIHVTWDPVTDDRQNVRGKLKGYQINYWNFVDDPEKYTHFIRHYGQRGEAMVIGLEENVDMVMDVQIFNTAGLGPRSNKFIMETSGYAPLTYPQEVHVSSAGISNVHVWWRGISLTVNEEALQGFAPTRLTYMTPLSYPQEVRISSAGKNKVHLWWRGVTITTDEEGQEGFAIWVWVATEEFSSARMIDIDIVFEYTVTDIKEGFVYALRLAAVGGGGYGVKTPTMYFTMEGQILLDSNFASTIDVYLSSSNEIHASLSLIVLLSSLLLLTQSFMTLS